MRKAAAIAIVLAACGPPPPAREPPARHASAGWSRCDVPLDRMRTHPDGWPPRENGRPDPTRADPAQFCYSAAAATDPRCLPHDDAALKATLRLRGNNVACAAGPFPRDDGPAGDRLCCYALLLTYEQ